nr:hypothetical protein [Pseudobdellovibrionaceae bacterium]
ALKNASKEIEPDFKTQQNASLDVAQFNIHVLNEILTSNEIAKDHLSFALFAEDFQKTNKCKELFYKEDLHNKESPITFSCFPKDNQYYSYGSNTPIDEWMTQIDSNINKHLPKLKNIKSKNLNTIESLYLMDQVIRDLNENLPYYLSGVFWVDPITEGNIINPFDQNIKISKEKLISALKREQNYIHNLHQNNTVRFNNAVKSFNDLKAFSNKKSSAKGYFAFERATLNKIVDESIDLLQTYPLESLFATIASKNANFLCDLGSLITDQKKSIALRNSLMTTFGFGLTLASIHPMVRSAKVLISTKGLVVGTKEMALRKVSDFKNLKNLDIKAAIKSSPSLLKKPKTYEGSLGPGLTIGSYSMNNEELNQRHISNIEGSRTSPFYNQGGQSFKLFDSMSSQETLKNEMITSLATTPSKLASLGYGTSEILNMVNSPDIGGLVNFKNSNHFSKEFCSKHKSTTVSYMCSKKYFLDK